MLGSSSLTCKTRKLISAFTFLTILPIWAIDALCDLTFGNFIALWFVDTKIVQHKPDLKDTLVSQHVEITGVVNPKLSNMEVSWC